MNDRLSQYIDLCRRGDSTSFEYIVIEYRQMIYTLAFRLLCDEDDAKDAAQETFIKVWQNISQYKEQYAFSTWIYRIATNVCYDIRRRARRKNTEIDIADCNLYFDADQDAQLNVQQLSELIRSITERLTPKQRVVFTLSELEGLSVEEISQITGLSAAKIKSNLYLARRYVKSKIENDEKR